MVVEHAGATEGPNAITRQEVEEVLEAHVLPYVRNHGGDLKVTGVSADGEVTCRLEGACRSCPAAAVTTVAVIERALQTHVGRGVRVAVPQIGMSAAAMERIRAFYPPRRVTDRRSR
jgi:Fe-S cluster biogenesis protein NfuA